MLRNISCSLKRDCDIHIEKICKRVHRFLALVYVYIIFNPGNIREKPNIKFHYRYI